MTEERTTANLIDSIRVEETLRQEIAVLDRMVAVGCPPALVQELTVLRQAREALLAKVTTVIHAAEIALPLDAARYLPEAEEPVPPPVTKG